MTEENKINQIDLLPYTLLDEDGYPTEEYLTFIKNYIPDESLTILQFIENVLPEGWWTPDWGVKLSKNKRKLELHTGGWSGNEEIIGAIRSNIYLTNFHMSYAMWKAGGHHYFDIKSTGS